LFVVEHATQKSALFGQHSDLSGLFVAEHATRQFPGALILPEEDPPFARCVAREKSDLEIDRFGPRTFENDFDDHAVRNREIRLL